MTLEQTNENLGCLVATAKISHIYMKLTKHDVVMRAARLGVLVAGLCLSITGPTFAASAFAGFEGSWRGQGTVSLTDGSREAIRCRALYGVRSDDALSVDVNCASDSYRVHILANVVAKGNALSGSWQETTRQLGGTVTGRVPKPGELQAAFETMGGGLQLSARVDQRRQVVIMNSQGTDLQAISISFTR